MSLQFNDTSTYKGIVQVIERRCGLSRGDISGNTDKLKETAAEVNLAWDDFMKIAIESSGTYQFDDSNQTDYPIIKTNIVSGQRDYTLGTDGSGNLTLDIYKVAIFTSATATQYTEITPVDTQSEPETASRFNDSSNTGVPFDYDKTGNGIIFGTVPNYNATNGLLLYINREPSYFTHSDTTKKPGCPGDFHEYFALRAAEKYALQNSLAIYPALRAERMEMEAKIKARFGRREKDVRKQITSRWINFR